jgi:branched-chain amino acid transport system permease protein
MSPSILVVQLLSGLAHAMVLFLIASGLSLIFGVTRVVNFAHGSLYMLAAYLTYTLTSALPLGAASFYVAVLAAAILVGIVGLLIEVGLLRRVYKAPELYQLLLTFALVLVIADLVKLGWGSENKTGPPAPGLAGSVPIAGQLFPSYDLALIVVGPLVALGLWWLFYRTRWGVLIRAATQDREMVAALGVDQARLFTAVFALGSALAGLGGALQVPRQPLTIVMDTTIITEAFVVVVIGGMGSVPGALLAAVLIGVIDAFGVLVLPKATLVMTFAVMAVVLIVRPWGLLGRPESQGRGAGGAIAAPVSSGVSRTWVIALLVALVAIPPLLPTFHVWVLVEILAFALFAASLHLLMGTGGMVSFGHAAAFGLGAYGAALSMKLLGVTMPVAFVLAPVVAAGCAVVIGFFCVRLSSIYFAMLTLAFAQIAYAIVHQWYDVTGGDNGLLGVWPARWLATPLRYYYLALAACAGGIAVLAIIGKAPFGLVLRAARDHARRAEAVGVNVRRHQWLAFVIAGFFGGLAGATFVFLKGSAFPDYFSVPRSVEPLVMVLLGGVHALAGAPIGAAIYKILDTVVTKYTEYWQLVLGVILVTLVLAFPRGVLGAVRTSRSRGAAVRGAAEGETSL